ncbi:AsmA family protein [Oceaniglobus indicus]|uniref:AsmA family protein n=1 Tax=Oceaniglobus indicus TaxID=2047749 RepID=UPI000C177C2B|nr:AsmA family protein [Oceaniglobus indicus]
MRWIFGGLLAVVVVVVLALAALFLVPAERIAALVAERFETATGRALTISGDVRPTLWPVLGVTADGVAVANAPWSDRGPMFRAQRLKVGVDALSLLTGEVRITEIAATAPDILLEIGRDGIGNWTLGRVQTEASPAPAPPAETTPARWSTFSLDKAVLRQGSLQFVDAQAGVDRVVSSVDLDLAVPGVDGRSTFDLRGLSNGQRVTAKGHIDGLAVFFDGGAVPLAVNVAAGGTSLSLNGRGGLNPPALAGRLAGDFGDLAAVTRALGIADVELPTGLGAEAFTVQGDLTVTPGTLNLRDTTLTLDATTFRGAADLTMGGERPVLNAKLVTPSLDLSRTLRRVDAPPADKFVAAGEPDISASGWSSAPIDVSALHLIDARLALVADAVTLGATKLGRTDLFTSLDRGRAVVEIREIKAYDGRVSGSVVVNGRGGLSSRVDVNGSALGISALLSEFLGFDRLNARGDLALNVLGVGNSMKALMGSLEGEGRFSTSAGELIGLDLAGMLRTLDLNHVGKGAKTIFDRISGSFTIRDGVLRNDDLAFLAPLLSASGAGQADIGERTLDYRIEARLLGDDGLRVPVTVRGPWAAPKVRLDLEALARENLKDEGRALEDQAKAKVKERIARELGVQIGEDERIEDVLKKSLEEEAKSRLLDLLRGN